MHELPITENILKIVCKHAQEAKAKQVSDIYLVIGNFSSIVDDSVQFYWDFIAKDTICELAKLHFRRIPSVMECDNCHHQYTLTNDLTPCPICNSIHIHLISGDEFYIESIDVIN